MNYCRNHNQRPAREFLCRKSKLLLLLKIQSLHHLSASWVLSRVFQTDIDLWVEHVTLFSFALALSIYFDFPPVSLRKLFYNSLALSSHWKAQTPWLQKLLQSLLVYPSYVRTGFYYLKILSDGLWILNFLDQNMPWLPFQKWSFSKTRSYGLCWIPSENRNN